MIDRYEEAVYAGILGKVVGVYMGRPIEGYDRESIKREFGLISGYVHERRNVPLVVPDDDIGGTLTFVRALEDSALFAETPPDFFGKTWLNYIIEHKTILWFGNMGRSTEHTALVRLKEGISSPRSGSLELNGPVVANQIGAQIFIDAFGMVAPGEPALAARLARMAAGVSHDDEAVDAAAAVASMISAAFTEKDMDRLLDIGQRCLKAGGVLASVYRDVRGWCRSDGNWEITRERIQQKYGYEKYGGGCHVVPNHAIMVMAWCYAPESFYESQVIINSAGWDTDCNAANVGALMGVKLGLAAINEDYEFQAPFADTVLVPCADGTFGVSDVLEQALLIAAIGRRIMGFGDRDLTKGGAWHHFSLPGSRHGYAVDQATFESRDTAVVQHEHAALRVDLRSIGKERVGRIKTPTMPASGSAVGYGVVATPRLYSGQTVQFCGRAAAITGGTTNVRAFVRHRVPAEEGQRNWQKLASLSYVERASAPIVLRAGEPFVLSFELPDTGGFPIEDLGLEFRSDTLASGTVYLESCSLSGAPELEYDLGSCSVTKEGPWSGTIDGFVSTMDFHDWHTNVPEWRGRAVAVGSNRGTGLLVTGNRFWRDYRVSAELSLVLADAGGIVLRYQGLERYLAVLQTREELVLVERFYDETVLTRVSSGVELNQPFTLEALCAGGRITVMKNGASVLEAETTHLLDGGAGLIARRGAMSAKRLVIAGS